MSRVGGLVLIALIGLAAARASADDAAAARFHDERAREHYAAGRYEEAIREFFLEQRIAPNARVVFNIAVCFQLLGRTAEAFQMYTEYLAADAADDDDDPERRRRAELAVEELAPQVARLAVTTRPAGARIYVDQREHGAYGRSPAVIAVQPGDHHVLIELEGHHPGEIDVSAARGAQVELELTLRPITGELEVVSSVAGRAEIRTPSGDVAAEGATPLTASLRPGPYEVVVTAEGHETYRGLAEIRESATIRHAAELDVLPQARGRLTVTATRPGALVTIDGVPAGFTPLVLEDLEVGARDVAIERAGVDPWRGEVEILTDAPGWLTLTLQDAVAETTHSPVTWILGATGLAVLAAGAVVGGLALDNRGGLEAVRGSDSVDIAAYRQYGESLNIAADTLFLVGATALLAAIVLFIIEETQPPPRSSASMSRSETVLDAEAP